MNEEKKTSNKKAILGVCTIAAVGIGIGIAGYLLGKKKGAEKLVDELMDIYDEVPRTREWPVFEQDKTHFLYEIKCECIGD